jgi:hypothetical protein
MGGVLDSLFFDTGAYVNTLFPATEEQVADHVDRANVDSLTSKLLQGSGASGTLDSLVIAGHSFKSVSFTQYQGNILGYVFMQQMGVVGFNHRTRQFILYH